jgi:hypothetical protein
MSERTSNREAFRIAELAFKCAVDGEYDTAAELFQAAGSLALNDPLAHYPYKPQWMYVLAEAADRMRQETAAQDARANRAATKEAR